LVLLNLIRVLVLAWSAGAFQQAAAPCAYLAGIEVRCGTVSVPEDRGAPQVRRLSIHYIVVPARRIASREPVFLFAGGPGQGSSSLLKWMIDRLEPVRELRDLVFVDQRGTGSSHALTCRTGIREQPERAFGHVFDPEAVRECRSELETRADLTRYTTSHAVDDIEDVRARLGYARILIWGGSYGTRLAQAYARRYPSRVAAMVLDGVAPFDVQLPSTYARGAQEAIDRVFAACRSSGACAESYPDLAREFDDIVGRLRAGAAGASVRTADGRPVAVRMSAGDFGYAVRGILYEPEAAARLPEMIHRAAATGDLSEFAQRYWARAVTLERTLALGLHLSVLCPEDVALAQDADIESRARGTFLGRYLVDEYRAACRLWPSAPAEPEMTRPLDANVPVLLLSGHFDPVTPPAFADRVASSLPDSSRHIVDASGGHGVSERCAMPAVLHVLTRATLDGLPAVCQ
jgi:pimeloyl-ACP methyl ester carboxylesterase